MYWLFTDETNTDPGQGIFFIYGGLTIEGAQLLAVHHAIATVRQTYGFQPEDKFKFETRSRPAGMDVERWTEAKAKALECAAAVGVDLIIYVVHHGIAAGQDADKRIEFALNTTIAHFDMRYLEEKHDVGAVCVDRLDPKFGYDYLRNRFQRPLDLPDGRTPPLERIIHYSMSCDGASHISSLVDIALGGARYCINAAMGNGSDRVAQQMFPSVAKLLWSKTVGATRQIGGYGFLRSPKVIRSESYKADYARLAQVLATYHGG